MKTLKDFKWFETEVTGTFHDGFEFELYERCDCDEVANLRDLFNSPEIHGKRLILLDDLRQSAIEWIKELLKRNITVILPGSYLYAFKPELKEEYNLAAIQMIHCLFNITEADLK